MTESAQPPIPELYGGLHLRTTSDAKRRPVSRAVPPRVRQSPKPNTSNFVEDDDYIINRKAAADSFTGRARSRGWISRSGSAPGCRRSTPDFFTNHRRPNLIIVGEERINLFHSYHIPDALEGTSGFFCPECRLVDRRRCERGLQLMWKIFAGMGNNGFPPMVGTRRVSMLVNNVGSFHGLAASPSSLRLSDFTRSPNLFTQKYLGPPNWQP